MISLVTWYNILYELNITSEILQKGGYGYKFSYKTTSSDLELPLKSRSDNGFEQVLIDAAEIAKELETEAKFEPDEWRRRTHKRQFKYEVKTRHHKILNRNLN